MTSRFSNLLSDLDGLSWSIRTESFSSDLSKPGSPVDDVIIHPDYENYQNDIGNKTSYITLASAL